MPNTWGFTKKLATVHKPKKFTWNKMYHLVIQQIFIEHYYVPHSVLALGTQHQRKQTKILAHIWPQGTSRLSNILTRTFLHHECHNSFLPLLQKQKGYPQQSDDPPLIRYCKTLKIFQCPLISPLAASWCWQTHASFHCSILIAMYLRVNCFSRLFLERIINKRMQIRNTKKLLSYYVYKVYLRHVED